MEEGIITRTISTFRSTAVSNTILAHMVQGYLKEEYNIDISIDALIKRIEDYLES